MGTTVSTSLRLTNFRQALHQLALTSSSIVSMYHTFFSCSVQLANCTHHLFFSYLKIVSQKRFSSITYRRIQVRLLRTVSYCFSRIRSYTLLSRPNIRQFRNLTLLYNLISLIKFYLNQMVLSRFNLPHKI